MAGSKLVGNRFIAEHREWQALLISWPWVARKSEPVVNREV